MVDSVFSGALLSPGGLLPLASVLSTLLGLLMAFLSIFLVLLVLIQRGRGGGLSGALGGPGGQSAFGSKAGDTFTLITVVVASVWGFVCAFSTGMLGVSQPSAFTDRETTLQGGPGNDVDGLTVPIEGEEDGEATSGEGDSGVGGLFSGEENVDLTPAMPDGDPADTAQDSDEAGTADTETSAESGTPADPESPADSEPTTGSGDEEPSGEAVEPSIDSGEGSGAEETVTETTPGE